jgi:HJR/Mrr/RecB family endonuclease
VFRLVTQALGALGLLLLAALALLWQWAAEHPLWALALGAGLVWLSAYGMRLQRAQREALQNDAHVPSMSPLEYERFVARELERAGWKVKHCGAAGDQGCDVLGYRDGFRLVVQVKLYRKPVGVSAVQEVVGSRRAYKAQLSAVVAPSGYTSAAQRLARVNDCLLLHHSQIADVARLAKIPQGQ